ncbi:MAG: FecR domain-containing protein [Niabella sp.]|nr:FecR domain-containing protein [Niabella sp.]
MITEEQIQRFFRRECSAEEADAVAAYLEQQPGVLNRYFNDEEWEQFQSARKLDPENRASLFAYIRQHTVRVRSSQKLRFLKYAAAAALLLLVYTGWLLLRPAKMVAPTVAASVKYVENTGTAVMTVLLPDRSVVQLMPSSSLHYPQPFDEKTRTVALSGEALFEVQKDPQHPFIVTSDGISTVVLGTRFLVRSFAKEHTIKVALYQGAVLVRSADTLRPVLKTVFHLVPGNVWVYDKARKSAAILESSVQKNHASPQGEKKTAARMLPENSWYMFNNQSLATVFDQLAVLYDQRIRYTPEDLEGLYFIGKIDRTDTLESVLQLIGRLHQLEIKKVPDGFSVRKLPR